MNEYQGTFKRYEKKYLLNQEQYKQLRQRTQNQIKVDGWGETTICNIYFDTPNHLLIRRSLEKPVYKEKLRLRSYGTPSEGDNVFIEIKKKYKGVVYKRREQMEITNAERFLYDNIPSEKHTQIIKEIDWFLKLYGNLKPSMYISYNRIALYDIKNKDLRITFDSNILYRETDLYLESGSWGTPLLENGQKLMEIKIPGIMPLWLSHTLDDLKIYPISFSKYGNGYKNKLIKGEKKYA